MLKKFAAFVCAILLLSATVSSPVFEPNSTERSALRLIGATGCAAIGIDCLLTSIGAFGRATDNQVLEQFNGPRARYDTRNALYFYQKSGINVILAALFGYVAKREFERNLSR